jgi:hypothetical protein
MGATIPIDTKHPRLLDLGVLPMPIGIKDFPIN